MTPLSPTHEWDKIKSEEQLAIRLKNIEQCIADRRAIARPTKGASSAAIRFAPKTFLRVQK
jgi:hypothetical protein